MNRLILEEGGARRAFRVNKGKLSIGSGEGCTLKLASTDVAEVHAELVVDEQGVLLQPRPGVLPPLLDGKPVKGPTRIPAGAEFQIADARFRLEAEGAAAPAPAPSAPKAGGAAGPRKPAVRAGAARAPSKPAAERSKVQPSKPLHRIQRGLPTWAVLAILGAVGLALFGFFKVFWRTADTTQYDPYERLRVAKEAYESAYNERALVELDRVDLARAPELAPQVEELRKRIASKDDAAKLTAWNAEGSTELENQIRGFFQKRMQGDNVPRERARVFVKRCREFRAKWPQHPEISWVERYQARFEPIARLDEPATYTDVAYDAETLTWAKPRDYASAFKVVRDFMSRASGSDYDQAKALEASLEQARSEYFTDRMQQAKWHWERNEPSKAVSELVLLVVFIGDEEMADQAARELVNLPRIDEHLRGYKNHRPDRWAALIENATVREAARKHELL